MKKLCMLMLLVCLILTAACGKPKATDNTIRLQGRTEAVLYTVKAPVDGEIRGLILDAGERIRKGQPLFGLGTQDENPEVEKNRHRAGQSPGPAEQCVPGKQRCQPRVRRCRCAKRPERGTERRTEL